MRRGTPSHPAVSFFPAHTHTPMELPCGRRGAPRILNTDPLRHSLAPRGFLTFPAAAFIFFRTQLYNPADNCLDRGTASHLAVFIFLPQWLLYFFHTQRQHLADKQLDRGTASHVTGSFFSRSGFHFSRTTRQQPGLLFFSPSTN